MLYFQLFCMTFLRCKFFIFTFLLNVILNILEKSKSKKFKKVYIKAVKNKREENENEKEF